MDILEIIEEAIMNLIQLLGVWGPILGCIFILIESIFPPLPLALFITLNFITFGSLLGFIMSWIFTVLGCLLSYIIFKKGFNHRFTRFIKDRDKLGDLVYKFENISLSSLVVIIAIPFTPAFLVNIAAGLSNMDFKKFLVAVLIGKIGLVYFWGYIGVTLITSLTNPIILLKVLLTVLIVYIISKIITKTLKIN